jgi:predicted aspartyl protease
MDAEVERMDAIAFEYASPRAPLIVVEARLGDQRDKVSVVLDTGGAAPFEVILSQAIAQRLGMALSEEITPPSTTAIGPRKQTYRTGKLAAFSLGPVSLRSVDVAVTPMVDQMGPQVGRRIDAVVGQYFLRSRTISIDYAARRLDLAAPAGPEAGAIGFTLGRLKPLVLVQATVNGAGPFTLQIDTGATGSTLSPGAAERAGVTAQGQGAMGGAGGSVAVGVARAQIAFGPIQRDLPVVAISDAIDAVSAVVGTPIDGILGTDFFQATRLTIDYPGQKLWLAPAR